MFSGSSCGPVPKTMSSSESQCGFLSSSSQPSGLFNRIYSSVKSTSLDPVTSSSFSCPSRILGQSEVFHSVSSWWDLMENLNLLTWPLWVSRRSRDFSPRSSWVAHLLTVTSSGVPGVLVQPLVVKPHCSHWMMRFSGRPRPWETGSPSAEETRVSTDLERTSHL